MSSDHESNPAGRGFGAATGSASAESADKCKHGVELSTVCKDGDEDLQPSCAPAACSPAPQWYTAEELRHWLRHWLRRHDYAPVIADELSAQYAENLQAAFAKGYEIGQREANDKAEPLPPDGERGRH